jgi:hypothetical protein
MRKVWVLFIEGYMFRFDYRATVINAEAPRFFKQLDFTEEHARIYKYACANE